MQLFKKNAKEISELMERVSGLETMINEKDLEITNLMNQVKDFDQEKAGYETAVSELKTDNATKAELITELNGKLELAERDANEFDNKVAAKTVEEISKIGHVPVEIEPDTNQPVMDVVNQYKKMKPGKEQIAFYEANKKAINKAYDRKI